MASTRLDQGESCLHQSCSGHRQTPGKREECPAEYQYAELGSHDKLPLASDAQILLYIKYCTSQGNLF